MCGISPKLKPLWPLEHFLFIMVWLDPTWQMFPTRGSISDVSFKEEWKRRLALASPRRRLKEPRAATALELNRVCREVQGRFDEVDEGVQSDNYREELFRRVGSKEKTIKIYPGMWHQLIGEPEKNVKLVFGEIVDWMKQHCRVEEGKSLDK